MEFRFDNNGNFSRGGTQDPYMFNSSSNTWSSEAFSKDANSSVRRKKAPTSVSDFEITVPEKKKKITPKAKYIAASKIRKRVKTKPLSLDFTWNKLGLVLSALLILRLIFMEGGVIDYYSMQEAIGKQEIELEMIKEENTSLVSQIHDLKTNPVYQKKIAREHLGVIAANEFLILFAQDQH